MEVDLKDVAHRVVNDVLRLKEEDVLDVTAWEHMLPLAKEVVKAARHAGADTLLSLEADDIWYDAMRNLPEKWLEEPSLVKQALRKATTAGAYIDGPADPGPMKEISGSRWQANSRGADATYRPFEDHPIPSVDITLGRVTPARAKTYGYDYDAWYRSVLSAMAQDPANLRAAGERLAAGLRRTGEGHLTAPGGTDFAFAFDGYSPAVFTGEVRPVPGERSSFFASLPSGALRVALKQGSGEGQVVSTTDIPQAGDFIRGLTWEFHGGRVTRIDAKKNLEFFTRLWEDKKADGADQLGALAIGLNPEALYGFLENEIVGGAVTLSLGDNEWLGGTNRSDYAFPISFAEATLEVDGAPVVEKGTLVGR